MLRNSYPFSIETEGSQENFIICLVVVSTYNETKLCIHRWAFTREVFSSHPPCSLTSYSHYAWKHECVFLLPQARWHCWKYSFSPVADGSCTQFFALSHSEVTRANWGNVLKCPHYVESVMTGPWRLYASVLSCAFELWRAPWVAWHPMMDVAHPGQWGRELLLFAASLPKTIAHPLFRGIAACVQTGWHDSERPKGQPALYKFIRGGKHKRGREAI